MKDKMNTTNEKIKELAAAINKATKQKVIITEPEKVEALPSGSLFIDSILGVGGYPFGRITEIFGGESAGKSTVCLTLCANAQKMGIIPTYIDVETSVDFDYAQKLGIDTNNWVLAQPDDAEDAFRTAEAAVLNGSKVIILDSVGALISHRETESEADIGDSTIGLLARTISKFVRRISPLLVKHNAALIMINQRRAKIGAMPGTSTEDTPGGYALKHAYSIRMKITRTGKESGEEPDFITSKVEVIKNKVAPPYGKNTIKIRFGRGIDLWSEVVQYATLYGIIKKSGSWYKYGGDDVYTVEKQKTDLTNIGQGEDSVVEWLKTRPDVIKRILQTIQAVIDVEFYEKCLLSA